MSKNIPPHAQAETKADPKGKAILASGARVDAMTGRSQEVGVIECADTSVEFAVRVPSWLDGTLLDFKALLQAPNKAPPWWPPIMPWPGLAADAVGRLKQSLTQMKEAKQTPAEAPEDLREAIKLAMTDIQTFKDGFDKTYAEAVKLFDAVDPLPIEGVEHDRAGVTAFALLVSPKAAPEDLDPIRMMSRDKCLTDDGGCLRASTQQVRCLKQSPQAVDVMVREAQNRGWSAIRARGTPEFVAALTEAAVKAGLTVKTEEPARSADAQAANAQTADAQAAQPEAERSSPQQASSQPAAEAQPTPESGSSPSPTAERSPEEVPADESPEVADGTPSSEDMDEDMDEDMQAPDVQSRPTMDLSAFAGLRKAAAANSAPAM